MFDWLFDGLATLLAWFYELVPSYGMAIIFLTLTIMIILTPLTLKGTRSMMAMQALQPEMRRLQQQYKDDRQKLNEELLKFYRENNINPLGGCMPLLLQMPVFIVLYQVLNGLTRTRSFGWLVQAAGGPPAGFDPKYLDQNSALYEALSGSREMVSWGIDLSESATRAMAESFTTGLPYLLLVLGVVVTSYVQQKQVSGRNPNSPMNPQQKMLLRIMPIFFAFISLNLPAALVVYFLVSNLYRVAQQEYISRKIYGPHKAAAAATGKPVETTATDVAADAPKGFFGRLLGDGSPRLGSGTGGNGASGKGAARPPTKRTGGTGPARPPSGRTTPVGGSHPRSRKKRKRR